MDNYNSQWRIWAKVVAIFDLITSIIALVSTLLIVFVAGATTVAIANSGTEESKTAEVAVVGWIIWVAVAILVIITTVAMWAAIKLIQATELGRQAKEAYEFCQSWRIVCILFIVLNLISDLMMESYIKLVICLLIRGVFLYVVQRYIQELETSIISPQSQIKPTQRV